MKALGAMLVVFVLVGALFVGTALLPLLLPLALVGTAPVLSPPGVVPAVAAVPPIGPMIGEGTPLLAAIAPWVGTPYVFGGNTRAGVDCSGFTLAIYRDVFRVQLPRTAQTQYNATTHPSSPEFGDLVYFAGTYDSRPDFISHVGIYIGDGWMVSAIAPYLGRQDLNSAYWRSHFVAYGRLPNG